MRVTKGRVISITAILVGSLIVFLALQGRKPTLRLSDGTILRLEKIDYGKKRPFRLDAWRARVQWVTDRLPAWLSKHLPNYNSSPATWGRGQLPSPDDDALYVWLTRYDPHSDRHVNTDLHWAEILDEHGCPFVAAEVGGMTYHRGTGVRGYEVGWFAFQAFPRRQRQFRIRLYDGQQKFVGEFVAPNPAPRESANWKAGPPPITRDDGDLSFTLKSLSVNAAPAAAGVQPDRLHLRPLIAPTFEVSERGRPGNEWEAVQIDLSDSLGNNASRWFPKYPYLCPLEPAWKLRVKFCASETGHLGSNASWTVGRLAVPKPGSFTALSATQQVQGVTLRLIGLAGAGRVTYSNEVPVRAEALSALEEKEYSQTSFGSSRPGGPSQMVHNVRTPIPHIALLVSGLTEDQRISIQATDDIGRRSYAKVWGWDVASEGFKDSGSPYFQVFIYNSPHFPGLDVSDDAKELDLTFRVHQVRTVEFTVKPPGRLP